MSTRGKRQVALACAEQPRDKNKTMQQQRDLVHAEPAQDQQPAKSKGRKVGIKQAEVRGRDADAR